MKRHCGWCGGEIAGDEECVLGAKYVYHIQCGKVVEKRNNLTAVLVVISICLLVGLALWLGLDWPTFN